jgi:hypothetical protein
MAETLFIAVEPFDPSDGERWQNYFQWANISSLNEVISLDSMLCPHIIKQIQDEDWAHIVNADFRLDYFLDLEYLLKKVAQSPRKHILGVYRNPEAHIKRPPAESFHFVGYDLIEETTQVSALTNCGGFPDSFSNEELNKFGLIDNFDRAAEIQRNLKEKNPDEPHADCELYAIWKLGADKNSVGPVG